MSWNPNLVLGISVYQDIVLAGQTVREGVRPSAERWRLVEPWVPRRGAVLDVGSNFGWFPWAIAQARPEMVVASVEGDLRTARVQRAVLASHQAERIALLTRRADARWASELAAAGQRLDLSLCLAVLHWMPDHAEFLRRLGAISASLIVEFPAADERGAGLATACRAMADPTAYLEQVLPGRPHRLLGWAANPRQPDCTRPLWWIGPPEGCEPRPAAGLCLEGLLTSRPSWPPRSWWLAALNRAGRRPASESDPASRPGTQASPEGSAAERGVPRWWLTPCGIESTGIADHRAKRRLARALRRLPEQTLLPPGELVYRRLRAAVGRGWQSLAESWRARSTRVSREAVAPRAAAASRGEASS